MLLKNYHLANFQYSVKTDKVKCIDFGGYIKLSYDDALVKMQENTYLKRKIQDDQADIVADCLNAFSEGFWEAIATNE